MGQSAQRASIICWGRKRGRLPVRADGLTDWLIPISWQYNFQVRQYSAAGFLVFQSACGTNGEEECVSICSLCREVLWPAVDHHDLDITVVRSGGGVTRHHEWPQSYYHKPSHPFNAGTQHTL